MAGVKSGVAVLPIDNTVKLYVYVVRVYVDPNDPKAPTYEQIENRLLDGVSWMDGVTEVSSDRT